MAYNPNQHHDSEQPVKMLADDSSTSAQRSHQESTDMEDTKLEHDEKIEHPHGPTLTGGQAVRPMLTTASEQDPDVAPDVQIRAISMSITTFQNTFI